MSPLGEKIARWMHSSPGPIRGKTPAEVWSAAKAACDATVKLPKETTQEDFIGAVFRAGYTVQNRRNFETGGETYVLALPEAF